MNKAIKMATGDVIGIINSDDFYTHKGILSKVARTLQEKSVDAVYGDLTFVDPDDLKRTVRKYSSMNWTPEKFAWGFMHALRISLLRIILLIRLLELTPPFLITTIFSGMYA